MKAVCDLKNGNLAKALQNSAREKGGDCRYCAENDLWNIGYQIPIVYFELNTHSLGEVLVRILPGELKRLA